MLTAAEGHPSNVPPFPEALSYDPRRTSEVVYSYLRQLIIGGSLDPGTELKQSVLARQYGVSRTPVREAFRRLQAEGLVEVEVNQRATVAELRIDEIGALYAARIAVESLGLQCSTGNLDSSEARAAEKQLSKMWDAGCSSDLHSWTSAHVEFHQSLLARAGIYSERVARSLALECDRFLFLYHKVRPRAPLTRHQEHEGLLSAVTGRNPLLSGRLIALHLGRTALSLIGDLDPERGLDVLLRAMRMVCAEEDLEWLLSGAADRPEPLPLGSVVEPM